MVVLDVAHILDAARGYVWAAIAAVVLWKLYPQIRKTLETRNFTIKVAGTELSVQNASDQLHLQVEDLQRQVAAIRAGAADREDGATEGEDAIAGPTAGDWGTSQRILWVDDHPENNAFLRKTLEDLGANVDEARSTNDALRMLGDRVAYDLVITDMGRTEEGRYDREAGLRLLEEVKRARLDVPVIVYASEPAIRSDGERALEAGALAATASPNDLLLSLRLKPMSELKATVAAHLRHVGFDVKRVPLHGEVDFVAKRDRDCLAVEVKKWRGPPDEKKIKKLKEQADRAKRLHRVSREVVVVRDRSSVPPAPVRDDIEVVAIGDLVERLRPARRSGLKA